MINIFMKKSKQVSESEETAKDVHDSKAVVKDDSLKRSKLIDIKVETPDDDEPERKAWQNFSVLKNLARFIHMKIIRIYLLSARMSVICSSLIIRE